MPIVVNYNILEMFHTWVSSCFNVWGRGGGAGGSLGLQVDRDPKPKTVEPRFSTSWVIWGFGQGFPILGRVGTLKILGVERVWGLGF